MAERDIFDVTIDTCSTCHGTWLDAGELARSMHASPKLEHTLRKRLVTGALDMQSDCPRCDTPLSRAHLDGLPLHTCMACQGLWLDHDAMEGLRERTKGGNYAAPVAAAAIVGTDVVSEGVGGFVGEGIGEGVAWVAESAVHLLVGIVAGVFDA